MDRIPLNIVTGFLGSGKTTLVSRLLAEPGFSGTRTIVNEFASVSIDGAVLENGGQPVLQVSSGCLCCSARGSLIDALVEAIQTDPPRVLIETSGIANPVSVFQAIGADPQLEARFTPGSVIAVIDIHDGVDTLLCHEEATSQIAGADIVLVSKTDLYPGDQGSKRFAEIRSLVNQINPAALWATTRDFDPAMLDRPPMPRNLTPARAHDTAGLGTLVLRAKTPVPHATAMAFADQMHSRFCDRILRMKGMVLTTEDQANPLLVQTAGNMVHEPVRLEGWVDEAPETCLVVIHRNGDEREMRKLFEGWFSVPGTDVADRSVLADNPLSIPGFDGTV